MWHKIATNLPRRAEHVRRQPKKREKPSAAQREQPMKYLRLMWITPALLARATFVGNAPARFQVQTERGEQRTTKRRSNAMPGFHNNFSLAKAFFSLMLLLFVSYAALRAFAQENTSGDSSIPLVYSVENTGSNYPTPSSQLSVSSQSFDLYQLRFSSPTELATLRSRTGSVGATRSRSRSKNMRLAQSLIVRSAPLRLRISRRRQDLTLVH